MAGLEHGLVVPNVCRWREAKTAHQAGTEIREDITEHVFGDHHIKLPRFLHHPKRCCIDIGMIGCEAGMLGGFGVKDFAEKRKRAEDIGLVHTRHTAGAAALGLAAVGKVECEGKEIF